MSTGLGERNACGGPRAELWNDLGSHQDRAAGAVSAQTKSSLSEGADGSSRRSLCQPLTCPLDSSVNVSTQNHIALQPRAWTACSLSGNSSGLGGVSAPGAASDTHHTGESGDRHGVGICREGGEGEGEEEGEGEGEGEGDLRECRSGRGGGGCGASSRPRQVVRPWGNFGLWYEGESMRGKNHGNGLLTNKQGTYDDSGQWEVGKNGIWWKSCHGEWENDKMTGPAVITWLDGEVFAGVRLLVRVLACALVPA